jgi:hypothetical protein
METRIGCTAMRNLLGHGGTNESRPHCALLSVAAPSFKTSDGGCSMRLFVRRSGGEKCGSGVAGHWIDGIARKQGVCMVQLRVSPDQFLTCSVTASGLLRRPAARRRSAFRTPLPEQVWAPAPECTAWHLGVAPTRIASPGVTRADREFKSGDSKCF